MKIRVYIYINHLLACPSSGTSGSTSVDGENREQIRSRCYIDR